MKELRGSASTHTSAGVKECVGFFAAVEDYPSWYPEVVRSVEVLEQGAGGHTSKARAVLHLARGPIVKDFDLVLEVVVQAGAVQLRRLAHDPSDQERFEVGWVARADVDTRLDLLLVATLSVPRLIPLGGVGDAIAGGFVTAASRALGDRHG
ncbi:MAG: hypothetical protein DLM64_15940 [Solirubrobacterales bacterium]|nr:MAG: hypothetical protein DLM64_15940 [Solirubrobacterales bacterium]